MQEQKKIQKNLADFTRPITADMVVDIETAAIDVKEIAALISVMQQSFFGGEPDPELMAEALSSVSTSLLRIYRDLDQIVNQIYGKGKE